MLELLVTFAFAALVAGGVVQLVRARPRISTLRSQVGAPGELSADAYVHRAAIAQWESQRDLIVAALLLLLSGGALTGLGDPLRRVFPGWDRGVGVGVFFAIGIAGVATAIIRASSRSAHLGLRCRHCTEPLPTSGDRMRDALRNGRCPSCRRILFTPVTRH